MLHVTLAFDLSIRSICPHLWIDAGLELDRDLAPSSNVTSSISPHSTPPSSTSSRHHPRPAIRLYVRTALIDPVATPSRKYVESVAAPDRQTPVDRMYSYGVSVYYYSRQVPPRHARSDRLVQEPRRFYRSWLVLGATGLASRLGF